jgi:excisionase family DNA binding protein
MMMRSDSHVLTVKELSDYLKVHPSTIYRQLKRGHLPAFKVGSDWRFNIESIDRWRLEQDTIN